MANLLGADIGTNYKGILSLDSTINTPLDATLRAVTDGEGNASPLQLSTTAVSLGGELQIVKNSFNLPIFSVKTPGSSNLFNVRNVNSNAAPIWALGASGYTTNLLFDNTIRFQVSNSLIATMTSTELQVGTISGARLAVKGSGTTSATTALLVQNSAGTNALQVRDDRVIIMAGIPTSAAGLPAGALWNNSGIINIV